MTKPVPAHPDTKRMVRIERTLKFAIEVDVSAYSGLGQQMTDEEITTYEVNKMTDKAEAIQDIYESAPFADDKDIEIITRVTFIETVVLDGDDSVSEASA